MLIGRRSPLRFVGKFVTVRPDWRPNCLLFNPAAAHHASLDWYDFLLVGEVIDLEHLVGRVRLALMETSRVGETFAAVSSRTGRYAAYLSALAGKRTDDVLLASFPRSGSTWIRLFLCNVISLHEWGGRDVDFQLVNRTMPALGLNNLMRPWPHSAIPRVVKTHRSYSPLFGGVRSIGLVRDPRDVMVSLFHYTRDRKATYTGSFSQFIRHPRHGLEAWFSHYTSWRDRWALTIKYEDMRADPTHEFLRIWEMIQPSAPRSLVQVAVARSNIRSVRKTEAARTDSAIEARFVRSGASGQWVTYFDDGDVELYRDLAATFDARVYP